MLEWDAVEPMANDDGRTTKAHPVNGEQVPDDVAQVTVLRYLGARQAQWPEAVLVSQAGGCPCFP